MGRSKRPHMPGAIFHLTTRAHRREPVFVRDLRTEVVRLIRETAGRTDAKLLGYVVMPNHLHVILRQGRAELKSVMQPLLRSVAHRVQRRHGVEGSVFERPYRDQPCLSPSHVREALIYVHLNPWRAGLCGDDLCYPWMSHLAYMPGAEPASLGIDPGARQSVLELFATREHEAPDDLGRDYLQWVRRAMARDRGHPATDATPGPPALCSTAVDAAWRRHLQATTANPSLDQPLPRLDLRDFVASQIPRLAAGCTTTDLRGSYLPRERARARAELFRYASDMGYRTTDLARLLAVSPSAVSMAKRARAARATPPGRSEPPGQ